MATIPKIAMIPSGYKAGKVYSVLPTNGDADLTFTRASEATRVDETGVIETMATGVPRLDYSDSGCPSLLVEPQSTNLLTYSENFSNAVWIKSSVTISENTALSPSNTLTADTWQSTGTVFPQLARTVSGLTIGQTYTYSIYVKSSESIQVEQRLLISGVSGVNFIPNINWQKIKLTFTATSTSHIFIIATNSGTATLSSFYIWGAQLEALPYATSYIPTVASTVTRVAETVSKTGLQNYINSREGSLYFYLKFPANNQTRVFSFSDGTNNTQIRFGSNTIGSFNFYIVKNSVIQVNANGGVNDKSYIKLGIRYKDNDCAFFVNGVKIASSLNCEMFDVNQLTTFKNDQGSGSSGIVTAYASIKEFEVFNQALSDAELQTLTTL